MRIVGGIYKSRVLCSFDGDKIRPTSDKVRESLFNIIRNRVYGSNFLDLFCGTGAMGIEALSRGAEKVVLNDFSKSSLQLAKQNLAKLKITSGVTVSLSDAVSYLSRTTEQFDVIFIDPPYGSGLGEKALSVCARALKDDGVAIFEDEVPFDGKIDGLKITDTRKYGRVYLTFFEKGDD